VVLASDVSALFAGAASAKLRGHVLGEKEAISCGDRAAAVSSREIRRVVAGFAGLAALAGVRTPRRAALGAAIGLRDSVAGIGLTWRLGLSVVSTAFWTAAAAAAGALVAAATAFWTAEWGSTGGAAGAGAAGAATAGAGAGADGAGAAGAGAAGATASVAGAATAAAGAATSVGAGTAGVDKPSCAHADGANTSATAAASTQVHNCRGDPNPIGIDVSFLLDPPARCPSGRRVKPGSSKVPRFVDDTLS
jgi:hypothetical protein